jgi:putative PIN family toxin of toxin-antitoxin system
VRLVLDTDVIVAAFRSPRGASAALLLAALEGRVTLLSSVALFIEYEASCTRPEHLMAAGLRPSEAVTFLDALASLVEPVEAYFLWRPSLRDPSDEMVLETAVNGRADGLVTFNLRDFGRVPQRFGIELLLPRDALERIGR